MIPHCPHIRLSLALLCALPLWLAACGDGHQAGNAAATPADPPVPNLSVTDAVANSEDAGNAGFEEPSNVANAVVAPTPDPMKGEKGARAVLLDWARALEKGDWETARAQWGPDSGIDAKAFAASYANYRQLTVAVGDGSVEGGAGSLYYEVPVTITGRTRDGRPVRVKGPMTVRRVNDVDGASAASLRWHLSGSDLKLPG
ncbi:MAG: hypothetical protein ABW184_10545 [Sphingobium sp.]